MLEFSTVNEIFSASDMINRLSYRSFTLCSRLEQFLLGFPGHNRTFVVSSEEAPRQLRRNNKILYIFSLQHEDLLPTHFIKY